MSPSSGANRTLAVAFLVTALTVSAADLDKRDALPTPEGWIGFAFAFLVMGALADLGAPEVAAGLAVLLMLSTLAVRGDEALRFLGSWQRGRRGRVPRQKLQRRRPGGRDDGSRARAEPENRSLA